LRCEISYSITSSAVASSVGSTSMPSTLSDPLLATVDEVISEVYCGTRRGDGPEGTSRKRWTRAALLLRYQAT
jgi:hypothetical protein